MNNQASDSTGNYVLAAIGIILGTLVCGMLATSIAGGRLSAPAFFQTTPTTAPRAPGRLELPADFTPGKVVTIRGSGFTPGERVEVFFARTENDRPDSWIKLSEAIGADRAADTGTFLLKNVVVPVGVGVPGVLFAREPRTQAMTVAISLVDGTPVNLLQVVDATLPTINNGGNPTRIATLAPPPATNTPTPFAPTNTPLPPLAFPTFPPLPTGGPATLLPVATLVGLPTLTPREVTPTPDTLAGDVWDATYFNNRFLSGAPLLHRGEPTINLNWGRGSPAPEIQPDNFSAVFQKWVNFETSDNYVFTLSMDDGARFYIDNVLVIGDQWFEGGYRVIETNRFLRRGQHRLRVEYFEATGYAAINLTWQPRYLNWQGTYYNSPNLEGEPAFQRDDAAINFEWGFGPPAPGVSSDQFSVSWKRVLTFPVASAWVFTATMDDGMRVYIDSVLVIGGYDGRGLRTLTSVVNINSGPHRVEVQSVDHSGAATAKLDWAPYVPPPTPTTTPTNTPTLAVTVVVIQSPTPITPVLTRVLLERRFQ